MNRMPVFYLWLPLLTSLYSPLQGQPFYQGPPQADSVVKCQDVRPAHAIDNNGNVSREFLAWVEADACPPAMWQPGFGAVVSAQVLTHKLPRGAREEFERGIQLLRKHREEEALMHFAEATRLDPLFVAAEAEQGVTYARMGQVSRALEHFEDALVVDPYSPVLWSNKAGALVALNRPQEGEDAARKSLRLAPLSLDSNYLLGLALCMQGKFTPEAAERLTVASEKYSKARELLEQIRAHSASENH